MEGEIEQAFRGKQAYEEIESLFDFRQNDGGWKFSTTKYEIVAYGATKLDVILNWIHIAGDYIELGGEE